MASYQTRVAKSQRAPAFFSPADVFLLAKCFRAPGERRRLIRRIGRVKAGSGFAFAGMTFAFVKATPLKAKGGFA
jgi:hypothetical protein